MVVIEALAVVLVGFLFALSTMALWIGLLGVLGAARIVRCSNCDRLEVVSTSMPPQACLRCRHAQVFHPVVTVHDAWSSHHPRRSVAPRGSSGFTPP